MDIVEWRGAFRQEAILAWCDLLIRRERPWMRVILFCVTDGGGSVWMAAMSQSLLLSGPRHGWWGSLLDAASRWPVVGQAFARAQRVRRKRYRAGLARAGHPPRSLIRSAPGRAWISALDVWLGFPPHPVSIPALEGAARDPAVRCSVIINTLARAEDLAITLRDLSRQWEGARDELIIVLGPDEDGSRERIAASGLACRLVDCPERNLAVSRNLGLSAARGEFIAFLDDDASPCEEWLERLLEPLRRDRAGASAGFALNGDGSRFLTRHVVCDLLGGATWWDEWEDAELHLQGDPRAFPTATGCNMAFRRDLLLQHGGFDPFYAYFLEETDLVLRLRMAGHPCHACPDAVVRHRQGANVARSPEASLAARCRMIRSQLHYIRKFAKNEHTHDEIRTAVWRRLLADLERIAWEDRSGAAVRQAEYLSTLAAGLQADPP